MDWTGGCLCGSIRYRASDAPHWASYCHCGMCRKVSGAPFMGFVEFPEGTFPPHLPFVPFAETMAIEARGQPI